MKSPFSSMTIWGAVTALGGALANWLGFNIVITEGDVTQAASSINDIVVAVGALLAMLGRWRAKAPLSLNVPKG